MFLFKREGRVKVALEPGEDIESRLERLVEVALDAEAEDFDSEDEDDGSRMIEVCDVCIFKRASYSYVCVVQVPDTVFAQAHFSVECPGGMPRSA